MAYLLTALVLLAASVSAAWRLIVWMPGRSPRAVHLPPLDQRQQQIRETLKRDVRMLAEEIGERNLAHRYPQLEATAQFLEAALRACGYDARRHEFSVQGRTVCNVEAQRTGANRPDEIVIIGAHYDTVPGSPGANDNGSAVAETLALARAFAQASPGRTLRFVSFVNEEAPYYMTQSMGSLRCAMRCRERRENVVGMLSLETIGCYLTHHGSQRYPSPLIAYLYPTTGDFVAVVGNIRSRRLVREVVRGLRRGSFPSQGIAAPRWLKDSFRSDHAPFWHCGFPALMVTDTANFRYPYYHKAEDTLDKLNLEMLARLVTALEESLAGLVGVES